MTSAPSDTGAMRALFHAASEAVTAGLKGREAFLLNFRAEESDFVRFNHSAVRQPGSVRQARIALDLIDGKRHAAGSIEVAGETGETLSRLARLMADLRVMRESVPEDPHLLYNTHPQSTERVRPGRIPPVRDALDQILSIGRGRDLVGLYAAGAVHTGFANSLGQRNWDTIETFNFDWSFYLSGDKAVKSAYAGFDWSPGELVAKADAAAALLEPLARPSRAIKPGRYRVYLSPAAMAEILGIVAWGGFGLRAHETKTTSLLRLISGDARLSPMVHITEHTELGAAPAFQSDGFLRPARVDLIRAGGHAGALISPRSAAEYSLETNGAETHEAPLAVALAPGDLPAADVLKAIGTGLYIGNLWYLNYSDRSAARLTGMTRFATFWVENGEIVAPLAVMRFDETIYNILGKNLLALTAEQDFMLDPGTYGGRSSESARLPGALVEDFAFTL